MGLGSFDGCEVVGGLEVGEDVLFLVTGFDYWYAFFIGGD